VFAILQGLVHLEALEMLSKQCDIKLQSLLLTSSGTALSQLQQSLQEVKDLCQLPDDEDTEEEEGDVVDWKGKLDTATKGLGVPIAADKLNRVSVRHGICGFLHMVFGIKLNMVIMNYSSVMPLRP
jgi:hypothetical protein